MRYWDLFGVARGLRACDSLVSRIMWIRFRNREQGAAPRNQTALALPTNATNTFRASEAAPSGASKASRATRPLRRRSIPSASMPVIRQSLPPQPQQLAGIELHRIGMVLVHMADDALLGVGQAARRRGIQLGGREPSDLAEARDQMGALDGNPIEVEILEAGIHLRVGMAAEETACQTGIVGARRAADQRHPRPGQGLVEAMGAVEQQRYAVDRRRWPCYARQGRSAAGSARGRGRPPPAPARRRARSPPSAGRAVRQGGAIEAAHEVADAAGHVFGLHDFKGWEPKAP